MSNPTLEATIDDTDRSQITITVSKDGTTYEDLTVDVETALQNQKFVTMFERPILTLLMLHDQTDEETNPAALVE